VSKSRFFLLIQINPQKEVQMLDKNIRRCTHIKVNGIRCGSPALRSEAFCYFHQRMIRGVQTPPSSRLHPMAILEDEEAIQASLMEMVNALVRNTIDLPRAQLILRAIFIASKNSPRVHLDTGEDWMIREAPTFPAAPARPASPEIMDAAEALARIKPPASVKAGKEAAAPQAAG
jgi:hypothetical protein